MMDGPVLPASANPVIMDRHVDKECLNMASKNVGFLLSVLGIRRNGFE